MHGPPLLSTYFQSDQQCIVWPSEHRIGNIVFFPIIYQMVVLPKPNQVVLVSVGWTFRCPMFVCPSDEWRYQLLTLVSFWERLLSWMSKDDEEVPRNDYIAARSTGVVFWDGRTFHQVFQHDFFVYTGNAPHGENVTQTSHLIGILMLCKYRTVCLSISDSSLSLLISHFICSQLFPTECK